MKKFQDDMIIIVMASVTFIALILMVIKGYYNNTHYTTCAYVDSITTDEVLLITPTGDIWAVDSVDGGVQQGQIVELLFYNNGTEETLLDDIIQHVRVI